MSNPILVQLLEHNNWANLQILDACALLTAEQLDAQPQSAAHGTIRETVEHLVLSQEDYLSLLTRFDHPPEREYALSFAELREVVTQSGSELVSLVQDPDKNLPQSQLEFPDGYRVRPWVIIVQVINHATEHREQIKSIMSALGVEPPRIDGWWYGRQSNALIPPSA